MGPQFYTVTGPTGKVPAGVSVQGSAQSTACNVEEAFLVWLGFKEDTRGPSC